LSDFSVLSKLERTLSHSQSDSNGTEENRIRSGTDQVQGFDDECNIYAANLPQEVTEEDFKNLFATFGDVVKAKLLIDLKTGQSKCNGFVLYSNPQSAESAINEMNGKTLPGGFPLFVRKAKANPKNKVGGQPVHVIHHYTPFASPHSLSSASSKMVSNSGAATGGLPALTANRRGGGDPASNPYAGYTASGSIGVEGVTKHTLFVYNLNADSSEIDLYSLFGRFGAIVDVHIQRDLSTGVGKGFGFVSFGEYSEASQAVQALNGYLYDKNGFRPLQVSFKKSK
jgi:RNA recognition motif-containing protein